jgi:hypothetical protein
MPDDKITIDDEQYGTGTWDADRVALAKLEIEQIDQKLKAKVAASNPPPAPDFEKMGAQEARKLIIKEYGFDPGWGH